MRKLMTYALLGFVGLLSASYAQEIPIGMKQIMENLQNDPESENGFNFAKTWRFITAETKFEDWHVGLPIEYYSFEGESLEKATENTRIDGLIVPTNIWRIPVRIKNKGYIYHVEAFCENNEFRVIGGGENVLGGRYWDKVREKYPEETGIRPVVIGMGRTKFVYFSNKKNGRSIFYLRNPKWDDTYSRKTSNSLDTLDEDKKFIQLWKIEWAKNKEEGRKLYEKHPDLLQLFEGKSGGAK